MLMSHSIRPKNAYIRYRVKVVTGKRLTAVRPFWLRANGCGKQVSYPVPGGGPPGSTSRRSSTWRVPMDGRIVAVGGHLHGSAKNMWLSQPRCKQPAPARHRAPLRHAEPPLLPRPPDPA